MRILGTSLLRKPEHDSKFFKYGDNVLSTCSYSIYKNITLKIKNYPEVDIMGAFYTSFLRYAKGDAKDKGIVLTPKHITELFCDLAEIFSGKKMNETTRVLDICCGTGAFLIAALNRMDWNITTDISRSEENRQIARKKIRDSCLVGIDEDEKMFALAYANMRFHGDGKSNLHCCSSLIKDNAVVYEHKEKEITLHQYLTSEERSWESEEEKKIWMKSSIGMMNPPYALFEAGKKDKDKKQAGKSELDFVYSLLSYIEEKGIGIAIVPLSCAHAKADLPMRRNILEKNTLLAVMTMPGKLFHESIVSVPTCIMVFRAGIPHKDSSQVVFFATLH
jgi:type I restriction-modification system DNA methylase subunit